ncbi:MAG: Uma2 family endonuclease [Hymenobacter sp.]
MTEDEFSPSARPHPELKFERRADGYHRPIWPLPEATHGRRNSELIADLTIWNRQTPAGPRVRLFTGFRLPSGAVRLARCGLGEHSRLGSPHRDASAASFHRCPEFVVELLLGLDSPDDLTEKVQEYIANGCRLAWLI